MKTSEFIKKVNEMGYKIIVKIYSINVYCEKGIIAMVSKNKSKKLDTLWDEYISDDLFNVCVEYAKTSIEERKEHKGSKKYYLYNPVKDLYFNYKHEVGVYGWSTHAQTSVCQTKFTEEEIKNHEFRGIMELLEKVEVE